jgi:hypothetical protein
MRNWLVGSFIDTSPPELFGGTLAPTFRIVPEGMRTYLVEEFGYGYIPAGSRYVPEGQLHGSLDRGPDVS